MSDTPFVNTNETVTPAAGLTARVARGTLLNAAGQSVSMLATLIAAPWVIRLLGAPTYGVLVLANGLPGYLSFADVGMGTASTRFASVAYARRDDRAEATAIWTSLLFSEAAVMTVAVLLAVTARPIVVDLLRLPVWIRDAAVVSIRIVAFGLIVRAMSGVMNTPALVRLRIELLVLITSGITTLQILTVPVVVYYGGGLVGAVSVSTGGAIVTAVLLTIVAMRLLPALRRPRISRDVLKSLAAFGSALMVSSVAEIVLMNAEKVLLPRYASVQALAYYSVAFTLAFMLTQVPNAMLQSLIPALSRMHGGGDDGGFAKLYRRSWHGMLYWVLAGGAFVTIVARPFFTLWAGPQFGRESTLPLYLLIGGVMLEIMSFVPYAVLIAYGRSDVVARSHIYLVVPYLAVSAQLIARFGAAGAAIGWTLRALAGTAIMLVLSRNISRLPAVPLPENIRDFAVAVCLLAAGVAAGLSITNVFVRGAVAVVAVGSYGALILWRVFTDDERAAFHELLHFRRRTS